MISYNDTENVGIFWHSPAILLIDGDKEEQIIIGPAVASQGIKLHTGIRIQIPESSMK